MFPTLAFGLLMLLVAARYALRPERRYVALIGIGESLVNVAFALVFAAD